MKSIASKVWHFVVAFAICRTFIIAAPCFALPSAGSSITIDQVSNSKKQETALKNGSVRFLVFKDELPANGIALKLGSLEGKTDSNGTLSWILREGSHEARLEAEDFQVKFAVLPEQETQVVVHLISSAAPSAQVDLPKDGTMEVRDLNSAQGQSVLVKLLSTQDQKPIPGASLMVSGFSGAVISDAQGIAKFQLPAGPHSVTLLHTRYQTEIRQIQMAASPMELSVELKPSEAELEEFVVLAPKIKGSVSALVEIRRNSSAVADVLGSEQMARSGDSDAASSLRRVTGLTLIKGKYVYVRGLGERYAGITMNGLGLPSPDPGHRVVPLDLFPASMLESVVIQKSFSPDLPAEFGGGLIQLKTKSMPERDYIKFSLTGGYEANGELMTYSGGQRDWFGADDGTRALPGDIHASLATGRKLAENNPPMFNNGFSTEELNRLGRELKNVYNVQKSSNTLPPGGTISVGKAWKIDAASLGASASVLHSTSGGNENSTSKRFNVSSANQPLSLDESAQTENTEVERKLGASADLGLDWNDRQKIRVGAMLVRHTSDEVTVKQSTRPSDSVSQRKTTSLEWTERQLMTGQISGKHLIPSFLAKPFELEWRYQRADAAQSAPDSREYTYLFRESGAWELNLDATGNRRTWSELTDTAHEWGVDLTLPIQAGVLGDFRAKTGFAIQNRNRRSDTWRLHFKNQMASNSSIDITQSPEKIFAAGNIRPDGFMLINLTESADSYRAGQDLSAGYAMTEWSPSDRWVFLSGARIERSRQQVDTFYYFDPSHPTSVAGLNMTDVLPAHSVTWKPAEKVRARLAYSETLARPEFRELSTAPFIDDQSGYETVGNASLRGTVIHNLDHRWEYYPSSDETLSIGFFRKAFESPIEQIFEPSPNLRKTFANAQSATNYGLELEGRTSLRRISREARRFTAMYNLSLIRSRIELGPEAAGVQTSNDRPLQGQSPWVANFQLQYDQPQYGAQATLLYNAVGARITEVGTSGRPDIYEKPFHQVDMVLSKSLTRNVQLGLRLKNLLDPDSISVQGDEVVRSYKKGRSLYVSLSGSI